MFKEIRYQELHKIINVTLLGGCRIFLQQSKVSSVHPTRSLNFQIDSKTVVRHVDFSGTCLLTKNTSFVNSLL